MKKLDRMFSFILLIAGFMLFWEWLRPLEQITDTGNNYLFVIYTAICFATSFFVKNKWAKFAVKFIAMLFIIDYLFFDVPLFSPSWIQMLWVEMKYNIMMIWDNHFSLMTAFFRSFLFLLLLWLMSYLLHYWFTVAQKFFAFIVLTFVYLAVLDTFTSYDAQIAMIRTFVVSFILLGMNRYVKVMKTVETEPRKKHVAGWMAIVVGIVGFAVVLGIISPKSEPKWPDPVPFIQSTANHPSFQNGGVQKVGYGEDDTQLGGSFVQDDSPVFEAMAHDNVYWRIESKDFYTGKGWERSADINFTEIENGRLAWQTFDHEQVESERYAASVRTVSTIPLPKAVYPYGTTTIEALGDEVFYTDSASGQIEPELSEQSSQLSYSIEYAAPSFEISELRVNSENDPEPIKEQYLQLPNSLPDRVGELAADIVQDLDNRFDKAQAIESYFSTNGFSYQTQDVAVPVGGDDYVDQFLFETQVGYCDNFSTSMVVMLRTLDIPARWVKGFTGGTVTDADYPLPDNYNLYEVTNNNAHSWVEVYFPETGWVPFEPTKGFSNPTDMYLDVSGEIDRTEPPEVEEEQPEEVEDDVTEEEREDDTNLEEDDNESASVDNERMSTGWKYFWTIIVILLVAIIAIVVYLKRDDWRDWYIQKKWQRIFAKLEFESSYMYLLVILEKQGIHRVKGQTLRQYALEVDQHLGTTEMSEITHAYEEYLYRNQASLLKDDKRLQSQFEQLTERIFA
ncbi:DUF4129 domain-containing transglutaminase family protein [Gracilibacillus sp. S3-1-1]|uniref:DUF4129 domain-containing transglutaminase family protein n=1 Tax=Gracilibacillus pellucidus TaxID=3095368 RepID=A0ACC6M7D1_9BACI|nr:DUF4129 domain-containing transglutaminase family protein [Gracilibacillus sp. S3-1-1]MDX8046757.1 DUF4129 domain-containing transglutaminase family protein [Gracilibacillus sp. S3-1-1]